MIDKIKSYIPNRFKRNTKFFLRNIVESFKYYTMDLGAFSCRLPSNKKKLSCIIFVCKGNVCRSAFAEQRFKKLVGDSDILIDSCGVDVDQGDFSPGDAVTVAAEFSCLLAGRRAKGVAEYDMQGADLILPMEYWQYKRLVQLYPEKKENILLLRSIAPFPYFLFCNISDPYGWGTEEFRRSYRLIDRALHKLLLWC